MESKEPLELPAARNTLFKSTSLPSIKQGLAVVFAFALICLSSSGYLTLSFRATVPHTLHQSPPYQCSGYLPSLFALDPPRRGQHLLRKASKDLDDFLSKRTSRDDIDSLYLAVVTSNGVVFEKGYGVARTNETGSEQYDVDGDTIYRIASISKMFTTLETILLKERGALNWDDPVSKYIKDFEYYPYGWNEYLGASTASTENASYPVITLRQLATHMSGIGRDYPPFDLDHFPPDEPFPAALHRVHTISSYPPIPQRPEVLKAIKQYPLVALPYTYPIYSNAGFDVLGWCNVAANADLESENAPESHPVLMQRDVFGPLGMNSSFFVTPHSDLAHRVAVSSLLPEEADVIFGDSDPAGGQYSSGKDLIKFMQTLLNPTAPKSLLSQAAVNEWMRPLHTWIDGFTEVGAAWEITKFLDSYGRPIPFYAKGGNLYTYHSEFVLNPKSSYGVVALMTGEFADTASLVVEAIERFQPAMDKILSRRSAALYAGLWKSPDGKSKVSIKVEGGSLWVREYIQNGTDVLRYLNPLTGNKPPQPLSLWPTGRAGEFRMAIGRPGLAPTAGCIAFWVTIDPLNSHGAPVDLVYFDEKEGISILNIPSVALQLKRSK